MKFLMFSMSRPYHIDRYDDYCPNWDLQPVEVGGHSCFFVRDIEADNMSDAQEVALKESCHAVIKNQITYPFYSIFNGITSGMAGLEMDRYIVIAEQHSYNPYHS